MTPRRALRWSAVLLAASTLGCADDPAPAGPATWEGLQPLLARSCNFSSCHGRAPGGGGLVLTGPDGYASVVGAASFEVPRLRRVVAGDPANSYLMMKVDNTMGALAECRLDASVPPCGASMPQGSDMLSAAEREQIRAWIRAGAPAR